MEINTIENIIHDYLNKTPDDIIAVFITGSVAKKEDNEKTSDLDLLIILSDSYEPSRLNELFDNMAKVDYLQIDCVAVKEKNLNSQPTLIDFMFKTALGIKRNITREDFLLNQKDCYEWGIQIGGSVTNYLIPDVPKGLLCESITYLLPNIIQYFKNPVLMLLRLAYANDRNKMCGKRKAAEWGIKHFDIKYHEMIESDYKSYVTGKQATYDEGLLKELEEEIWKRFLND